MKTTFITEQAEIESIIHSCQTCVVSFGSTEPYALPMNFAYRDQCIYLHSGPEGHKLDLLAQNSKVCIVFISPNQKLVCQHPDVGCSYSMKGKSVMAFGKTELIETNSEKREIMDFFMKQYTEHPVSYGEAAIAHVKVWRVKIDKMTAKHFGQSQKNY